MPVALFLVSVSAARSRFDKKSLVEVGVSFLGLVFTSLALNMRVEAVELDRYGTGYR